MSGKHLTEIAILRQNNFFPAFSLSGREAGTAVSNTPTPCDDRRRPDRRVVGRARLMRRSFEIAVTSGSKGGPR